MINDAIIEESGRRGRLIGVSFSAILARATPVNEGTHVGPYVVRRHLGDGGMGSVWLADDTRLHRQVALKTLHAARGTGTAGRERLMREARAAAALNHPQIAAVYDVLEVDGDVAIVLEYVEGQTLAEALSNGPWPFDRVTDAALQLAKALRAAHSQGVVHRDLKPANVIIGTDGLKVLDFGIARLLPMGTTITVGHETTSGPGFMGTPAYAAPEQLLSSAVDERADLYALGVILFEMAAGKRPFPGHDAVTLAKDKLGQDAPLLSAVGARVPAAFESLVSALLQRDPAARPSSANDVVRALQEITGTASTTALSPGRRPRVALWGAAALALAATVAALVIALPRRSTEPAASATGAQVVAVLPLRNTSGDQSKDYLAAGLSESLISGLAASPSLIVLSRSAVADAMKNGGSTGEAIKVLNASYVIDGSMQQSDRQLRVAINLVRADQSIAWGRTFDGTIDRVFDLQTRMSLGVSEAMSAGRPSATDRPASTTAQESYWRGRAFLDRWDVKGNVDAAISSFSEAIGEDPNFALAHAALGIAYWRKYSETRDQQFARLAVDAASRAASIEPDEPEVRVALAQTLAGTGRADEAVVQLRKALELRPTSDEALRQLGNVLAKQGKIDEAIPEYRKAIALRPRYWGGYSDLGTQLFAAGRHAEAAKAVEEVVALQPDSYIGFQQLGTIYQSMGESAKAIEAYRKSVSIRPSFGVFSNLGTLHYANRDYATAVDAYQEAIKQRPAVATGYRNLGDALAKLGKKDDAQRAYLTAIERAQADLSVNPNSARSLAALALYQARAGRAADAFLTIAKAIKIAPDDAQVRFRAAVVNASAGRADEALNQIAAAIERGYSVVAIREDEDFASLRQTTQFRKLTDTRRPQ